jgi:excisionase family DNA binding protein
VIDRTTPVDQWPSLLRVEEAAALLDCSKGLIYDMVRRHQLPSVRLGRLVRIPREALAVMVGHELIADTSLRTEAHDRH